MTRTGTGASLLTHLAEIGSPESISLPNQIAEALQARHRAAPMSIIDVNAILGTW